MGEPAGPPADPEDAGAADTPDEAGSSSPPSTPPLVLPRPGLPDEPALDPAAPPAEPQEPEQPQVLHRIGLGDHPPDGGEPLPRDVPFVVPGDARVDGPSEVRLTEEEPDRPLPPFSLGVGAGFGRLLAEEPLDLWRLHQFFEARIPGFEALTLGVGAAELFDGSRFLFEGGPRAGLSAGFCQTSWLRCNGSIIVQPGVATGFFGTRFSLHGTLRLGFLIERIVELRAVGGYSLLGTTSLLHAGGGVGLVF